MTNDHESIQSSIESDAMDQLAKLTEQSIPRVKESLFKSRYLPILLAKGQKVDMQYWLEVSNSPYQAVIVVDDRTGEELFKVPPILKSGDIFKNTTGKTSMYEVLSTAKKKEAILPRMGTVYLENEVNNRLNNTVNTNDEVKAWVEILKRYGIEINAMVNDGTIDSVIREEEPDDFLTGDIKEL